MITSHSRLDNNSLVWLKGLRNGINKRTLYLMPSLTRDDRDADTSVSSCCDRSMKSDQGESEFTLDEPEKARIPEEIKAQRSKRKSTRVDNDSDDLPIWVY